MERKFYEQNLGSFERRRRLMPIPRRFSKFFVILASGVVFTLLWHFVSAPILYWLLLTVFAILIWIATYGWRFALRRLHIWIEMLEQIE
jgi:hypothetical protein